MLNWSHICKHIQVLLGVQAAVQVSLNSCAPVQVIAETHGFYNALKASKVGNGLSLV